MQLRLIVVMLLIFGSYPLPASEPPDPCSSPEYRQFDFWLGEWTAFSEEGEKQGTNHLRQVMGQCAIQENWESARGPYRGTSYNFYNSRTGKWHQTWIDNRGGHLFLDGGMRGKSMQLSGERTTAEGEKRIDRITWTPLEDGRVRQHWQASTDGGKTWEDVFDGYYEKQESGD